MKQRLTIQPEAEGDLDTAFHWYEHQRSGLGREFQLAVEKVFQEISERPQIYRVT